MLMRGLQACPLGGSGLGATSAERGTTLFHGEIFGATRGRAMEGRGPDTEFNHTVSDSMVPG